MSDPMNWLFRPDRIFQCRRCGVRVKAAYGDKRRVYCSDRCARKAGKATTPQKHIRRAKKRGLAADAGITLEKVGTRDGWLCGICAEPVRRDVHPNDGQAPSIDHIVALADPSSPGHVWSNVQCAHRDCNTRKMTRGGT